MKDETFNGYSNWETWAIGVLIDNDEDIYNEIRKQRFYKESQIEEFIKELFPEGIPDYEREGKEACYKEVDWSEILEIVEGMS